MTARPPDRVTVPVVRDSKRRRGAEPLVMVTAYDAPTAACVDGAGVDMILVGDSLGPVVLGYADALGVSIEDMSRHVAAVARARSRPLIVADLPWMTYHTGARDALSNAASLIRSGADAVKLEGDRPAVVEALAGAEIPVMAHLGVTPQSTRMAGSSGPATAADGAPRVLDAARRMEDAGCFAVLLSCVPGTVAAAVTEALAVPTVGYGAGPACDGQVLILHDVIGLTGGDPPKFVRRYADVAGSIARAVGAYAADVRSGRFPSDAETYAIGEGAAGEGPGGEGAGGEGPGGEGAGEGSPLAGHAVGPT